MTFRAPPHTEPPRWIWLVVPLVILLLPYAFEAFAPGYNDEPMYGELGFIENLTVLLLVAAVGYGIKAYRRASAYPVPWFRYWLLMLSLGCLYFAGEEISWGQKYVGWSTPEFWQSVNDQQETNLHNTSALFDQIPRTLLTVAAVVGGVLVPAFVRRKNWQPTQLKYWLWPTYVCLPAALLASLVHLPEKLPATYQSVIPAAFVNIRGGESKECLLAAFLLVYLASIASRAGGARTPNLLNSRPPLAAF